MKRLLFASALGALFSLGAILAVQAASAQSGPGCACEHCECGPECACPRARAE